MRLLMWFQSGQLALVPLSANRFCEMMSELTVAWQLLEGALVAEQAKVKVAEGHPRCRVLRRQDSGSLVLCT